MRKQLFLKKEPTKVKLTLSVDKETLEKATNKHPNANLSYIMEQCLEALAESKSGVLYIEEH